MCPVAPHFSLPDSVEKYILGTIMTYIYNTFFNTITKRLYYTDMYAELAFRKHVLDSPANKVIDLPVPMIPNGGGKETFTCHGLLVLFSVLVLVQQLVLF